MTPPGAPPTACQAQDRVPPGAPIACAGLSRRPGGRAGATQPPRVAGVAAVLWLLLCWCGACGQTPRPRVPTRQEPDRAWQPSTWAEAQDAPPRVSPARETPPASPPEQPAPTPAVERVSAVGPGEVPIFRDGEQVGTIARSQAEASGLFVLDVGSDWVPAPFRSSPELPHAYERVFARLANGRFDDGPEGRRAAEERYLEPYGIPPSPALLAQRFAALADRPCSTRLDLQPLRDFEGAAWDEGAEPPPVPEPVIAALQTRLVCEEHLHVWPSGVLDENTRRALEEFERRNRIYARGSLKGETLEALRAEPLELERRALVRVLSERMALDLGVIEDGSGADAVPAREAGELGAAPDMLARIQQRVLEAFDLQTVAGVEQLYRRLEGVLATPHYGIAIDTVDLPDYYSNDMDLWVEIDRGDFYYEFPFDAAGRPLGLRIERGPTLTLFARDGGRVWPLARYPTTIGGWRVRHEHGAWYWEYKESPVGVRAWGRIVTAPVWLPPRSTPPETLVETLRRTSDGSELHEINHDLIGPSFASAYGLVAAYHQRVVRGSDGQLELRGDDGIRTHGSSDYTSIWRSVSSGCHRLYNHLAIRLFNFVLMHRAHLRIGHRPISYSLRVKTPDFRGRIEVAHSGYEFELARPLEVDVLPGRILGRLKRPLGRRIPAREDASARPKVVVTPTGPGPS